MARAIRGFTIVEMMVAIALLLVVMSGVASLYLAHRSARVSEDLSQTVEAGLRLGMDRLLFKLRNAGYGASWGNPTLWVTWVTPSFTGNPMVAPGADASTPDTLSIGSCTSTPVARLAADAAAGASTLTLDSAANLDASSRSVIMISDSESVKILSTSSNTINIDANPDETEAPGAQGVSKVYRTGTPICRVDVVTYSVDTATATLLEDLNQGAGAQVIVDGIANMQITTDTTGVKPKYTIALTAQAIAADPLTTTVTQRSLTSIATARN